MLRDEAPAHWARGVLESHGRLVPVDSLSGSGRKNRVDLLVMAQPRPLAPEENLALDRWVRRGGRVLLFADPMLTQESAFAFGDRRRPEAMVMLSPILRRWGLELHFDEGQPYGPREIDVMAMPLPVDQVGRFAVRGRQHRCHDFADGVAVRCRIGRGQVLAIADAALLEVGEDAARSARAAILDRLVLDLIAHM